jgi:hypothetical protein
MALIPIEFLVERIHRSGFAFQHLKKTAIGMQKHAGDVQRLIQLAGSPQNIGKAVWPEFLRCAAGVDKLYQLRHFDLSILRATTSAIGA